MKESLGTTVFVVVVLTTCYVVGALPGYFWYHFRKDHLRHYNRDIALLLIPFLLYIGLNFIDDRQGFFVPLAVLLIGICVSISFILRYFFPPIDGHYLTVTVLIAIVLACWIFFPESKMKMM